MDSPSYLYVVVRKDLSPEQIAVQASHAAFDAGKLFGAGLNPHLVLCTVDGPEDLAKAHQALDVSELPMCRFYEPDNDMGYSALACLARTPAQRKPFRRFKLYRATS